MMPPAPAKPAAAVPRRVEINNIHGYLLGRIVQFLSNMHNTPHSIYLTRHGQSEYNRVGKIGGDSPITAAGDRYARKLAEFCLENVAKNDKGERVRCAAARCACALRLRAAPARCACAPAARSARQLPRSRASALSPGPSHPVPEHRMQSRTILQSWSVLHRPGASRTVLERPTHSRSVPSSPGEVHAVPASRAPPARPAAARGCGRRR